MNFLMLRGQIPQDRDPQEIVFDNLKEVDDMWTHLFFNLLGSEDRGELWYWGGEREKQFTSNFTERWVPTFAEYSLRYVNPKKPTIEPNVIFCRGGFKEYHNVLKRFPAAIKIYYGAGARFLPQPGFYDYNIILQDSEEQVKICKLGFPKALTTLFIKPATDNLFYPMPNIEKEYDVCFPANAAQSFKGHFFVYSTVPKDMKLLNLGNRTDRYSYPDNVTSYRVLRHNMAENMAKCKVGIVAVQNEVDSCPRVIPEMLACNIPIVVLDDVRFWKEKYIVSGLTGELANRENFWDVVRYVLENYNRYIPREYYVNNLSLKHAALFIREKIDGIRI